MKRTTALALLGLACLMAMPSIAHARYRDGMNLYQYVGSAPVQHMDPYGQQTSRPSAPQYKELTVALHATGFGEGSFSQWAVKVTGRRNSAMRKQFATGKDVMAALASWTRTRDELENPDEEKCTCMKNLYVFSHAWVDQSASGASHQGGFYGGGPGDSGFYGIIRTKMNDDGEEERQDHADARSIADLKKAIDDGSVVFCGGCQITLTGCRITSTGNFADQLTLITGCTVRAASGACDGTKAPRFKSGPKTWAERQRAGKRPWQQLQVSETKDPDTGEVKREVKRKDLGTWLKLW